MVAVARVRGGGLLTLSQWTGARNFESRQRPQRRRVGLGRLWQRPTAQRGLRVWDIERSHGLRHTEGAQRRGETGELTERPEEAQRG